MRLNLSLLFALVCGISFVPALSFADDVNKENSTAKKQIEDSEDPIVRLLKGYVLMPGAKKRYTTTIVDEWINSAVYNLGDTLLASEEDYKSFFSKKKPVLDKSYGGPIHQAVKLFGNLRINRKYLDVDLIEMLTWAPGKNTKWYGKKGKLFPDIQEDYPAAQALIEIGRPSIHKLQRLLDRNPCSKAKRKIALFSLLKIESDDQYHVSPDSEYIKHMVAFRIKEQYRGDDEWAKEFSEDISRWIKDYKVPKDIAEIRRKKAVVRAEKLRKQFKQSDQLRPYTKCSKKPYPCRRKYTKFKRATDCYPYQRLLKNKRYMPLGDKKKDISNAVTPYDLVTSQWEYVYDGLLKVLSKKIKHAKDSPYAGNPPYNKVHPDEEAIYLLSKLKCKKAVPQILKSLTYNFRLLKDDRMKGDRDVLKKPDEFSDFANEYPAAAALSLIGQPAVEPLVRLLLNKKSSPFERRIAIHTLLLIEALSYTGFAEGEKRLEKIDIDMLSERLRYRFEKQGKEADAKFVQETLNWVKNYNPKTNG